MKWLKRDIKIMCSTLSTFWLTNRPPYGVTPEQVAEVRSFLAGPVRVSVVCAGIENLTELNRERAVEALKTAEHYRTHPNVMGTSTPEIVERFTRLAGEYESDMKIGITLIEKIKANGLPVEVLEYDPTARRS